MCPNDFIFATGTTYNDNEWAVTKIPRNRQLHEGSRQQILLIGSIHKLYSTRQSKFIFKVKSRSGAWNMFACPRF